MKKKAKKLSKKKVTYYIDPLLVKRLKYLSVYLDRNCSSLVNQAIQEFVKIREELKEKLRHVKKKAK